MALKDQQTKFNANREKFAKEIEARTKSGQRLGLFSYPMALTVGDSSTNYQKDRKPADQVGKIKGFSNNRGKSTTTETFGKLISNAIGDEYQDPKYFLRSGAGKKAVSKNSFKSGGNGKLTKHSEFVHMTEYDQPIKGPKKVPTNFMTKAANQTFQSGFQYVEDAYERKEDMRKLDYQRRAAQILDKNQPYTSAVYQHGTFEPFRKTYGSDKAFGRKISVKDAPPNFGPFKIGGLPKKGYNKTLGKNPQYIEDPIEDTVTYQKDIKNPVWRGPTHVTSMAYAPMSSHYKNTSGMLKK